MIMILALVTLAQDPAPLMLDRGERIFIEDFSENEISPNWISNKGTWEIVDGALRGTERESDKHNATIRTELAIPENAIVQFKFRFDGGETIHLSFNGKGHICRVILTPEGFVLKGEKIKKDPKDKAVVVSQVAQAFGRGTWYTMLVELQGEEFVARVDDGPVAFGRHAKIARPKSVFGFPMAGDHSSVDAIRVWKGSPKADWKDVRAQLPPTREVPTSPPDRFARFDKNGNGSLSAEEFLANRTGDKRDSAAKAFKRRDKNGDGGLSRGEFSPEKKP